MSESVISDQEIRYLIREEAAILVVKSETDHGYENSLTRRWDDIDDSKRDDCAALLRRYGSAANTDASIASMEGPLASRYKREGTWYFGPVEERRDEATGKVAIWQTLFKSTTTVYSKFIVAEDCSEVVTRSLYLNYNAQPDTPDNTPGVTYSVSQTLVDPKTGAYTFWIDKSVAKSQIKTYDSLKSESETAQTVEEKAVADPATSMTPGDGEVRTRNQRVRKDCLVDSETDIKKAVNQIEKIVEVRADVTTTATINTQQVDASLPADPPVPAAGEIKSIRLEPTPFKDRTKATEEVKSVTDQAQTANLTRADLTESTTRHTAATTALTPPTVAAGQIVESSSKPTEFKDRHLTEQTVKTVISQTQSASVERADETVATTRITAADTPLTPPPASAGQIVEASSKPTEFKDRHLTEQTIRTAVNQVQTKREVRADLTESVEVNTQVSTGSLPDNPPVPAAGQTKSLDILPTEFKDRAKTIATTRDAINQIIVAKEVRADETTVSTVNTQVADGALPADPPVPGAGQIKTLKIDPTEFKERNRTTEETRAVIDQTQTVKEVRADQSSVVTVHTAQDVASLPVTPPSPATGQYMTVKLEPTPFVDRTRTTEETVTGTDILHTSKEFRADQTVVRTRHTVGDAVPGAAQTGKVVRVENRPTQFKDKLQTEEEVITPTFMWTGWVGYQDRYGLSHTCGFVNATDADLTTIKSSFTSTTQNGMSARKNEFGLYDGSASRIAVDDSGGGGSSDWSTGFDFNIPVCKKGSKYESFRAWINFTTSRIQAQSFLNTSQAYGTLVDFGAGEATGIRFLGRGRFRVCRVEAI